VAAAVQITDFGLSRWKQYSYEMSGRQVSGGGTVTHIPPESWSNINLPRDQKFDVYGFGVLLWEIFSERRPFDGGRSRRRLLHHARRSLSTVGGTHSGQSTPPPTTVLLSFTFIPP